MSKTRLNRPNNTRSPTYVKVIWPEQWGTYNNGNNAAKRAKRQRAKASRAAAIASIGR